MPVQHVKGQPAASTYVREKGGVKIHVDLWTPCTLLLGKRVKHKIISLKSMQSGRTAAVGFTNAHRRRS